MTRFLSTRLDLSRLRAIRPVVLETLDFEAIISARLASLQERFDAAAEVTGTDPLDVLSLETDPVVILQQEDAYRQLLDMGLLNDKLRALLPAFAQGADLDHIAARAGITRTVIRPASDGVAAVMEDDDTFRLRYWASFGRPAAGSEDAYIFAALTAYPTAWHVYCTGPAEHGEPGRVDVIVTGPAEPDLTASEIAADVLAIPNFALIRDLPEQVPPATLDAIARACTARDVRPLTDMVNVVGAEVVPYVVTMTVEVLPGPDPKAIKAEVLTRLQAITAERYRGGGEVPKSALASAGYEAGAVAVAVTSPAADITRVPEIAPFATTLNVTVTERLND